MNCKASSHRSERHYGLQLPFWEPSQNQSYVAGSFFLTAEKRGRIRPRWWVCCHPKLQEVTAGIESMIRKQWVSWQCWKQGALHGGRWFRNPHAHRHFWVSVVTAHICPLAEKLSKDWLMSSKQKTQKRLLFFLVLMWLSQNSSLFCAEEKLRKPEQFRICSHFLFHPYIPNNVFLVIWYDQPRFVWIDQSVFFYLTWVRKCCNRTARSICGSVLCVLFSKYRKNTVSKCIFFFFANKNAVNTLLLLSLMTEYLG